MFHWWLSRSPVIATCHVYSTFWTQCAFCQLAENDAYQLSSSFYLAISQSKIREEQLQHFHSTFEGLLSIVARLISILDNWLLTGRTDWGWRIRLHENCFPITNESEVESWGLTISSPAQSLIHDLTSKHESTFCDRKSVATIQSRLLHRLHYNIGSLQPA